MSSEYIQRAEGEEHTISEDLGLQMKTTPVWGLSIAFHVVLLGILTWITFAAPIRKRKDILVIKTQPIQEKKKIKESRPEFLRKDAVLVKADLDKLLEPSPLMPEEFDPNLDIQCEPTAASELHMEEDLDRMELSEPGMNAMIGLGSGGPAGGHRYATRLGPDKIRNIKTHLTPQGCRAIAMALKWLARHQEADGRWSCRKHGGSHAAEGGDPAVTGLALLAFLADGHTEFIGKHHKTVRSGIQWLIRNQKKNGQWGSRNYEHGICLMAVCESLGMGGGSMTREAALNGVAYCLSQQNPTGAWNYTRSHTRDDMSVTGWNIMGLKSALVAGIQKTRIKQAFRKCSTFFDKQKGTGDNTSESQGLAWYTPDRVRGKEPGDACVAIAMLCRQFMGWRRTEFWLQAAADNQVKQIPVWEKRNVYRMYYASLTLFQMGSQWYRKWNASVRDMIVNHQRDGDDSVRGSWDFDSKWCRHGGRVMSTAMLCMCLESCYKFEYFYYR